MTVILNSKHTIPVTNGGAVGTLTTSQLNGTSIAWPNNGAGSPLTVGTVYTTNTTSGQFLSSGINGATWTNPTSLGDNILTVQNTPASLDVKGKVIINGKDLEERLDVIEKVLQIPERDVKLEKKYPKLKKLYDEYIQALGKYRTFEAIKGDE